MGKREWAALAAAISVFLGLGLWLGQTKAPWCDEAWFANPAYNLAFRGHMGTNVLEPSGHFLNAYLTGIRERTYIVTPNHLVGLAAWFKFAGFSLLSQRVYSLLWGAVGLAGLFVLLRQTFPGLPLAALAAGFLAIDFVFLWGSADGRMESTALALALWSLVAYLHWRERHLTKAVAVSQCLLAAACFVHPYALLPGLCVPLGALWLDGRRLQWLRHGAVAAAPYLVFAMLWGVYILESPEAFRAQFFANAGGHQSERWKNMLTPWNGIWQEMVRQVAVYCTGGLWGAVRNDAAIPLCFFYWGALIYFWRSRRRLDRNGRIFGMSLAAVLLSMTFLNGFKAFNYMIYLQPFYCGAMAYWVRGWWVSGAAGRWSASTLVALVVLLQGYRIVSHIAADEYGREYLPAVAVLERDRAQGRSIMATSAIGYEMGFRGFEDDWRLGLHTGRRPDVLLMDRSYRHFACRFEDKEPRTFARVVEALTREYRLRQRLGSYWIFERRSPEDAAPARTEGELIARDGDGKAGPAFFSRVAGETIERCGG